MKEDIPGEMLFMRGNVGCIFSDCRRNAEIIAELQSSQITEFIK
jgi:hypothetical protein